jgi:hypothetical protein
MTQNSNPGASEATIEVLNPVAQRVTPVKPAPRLETLDGKKIMLFFNGKHTGELFRERVREGMEKRVKDADYIYFDQKLLFTSLLTEEMAEIEAAKPDAVVALWCA